MIFITTGTQEPFDRLLVSMMHYLQDTNQQVVIQAKTELKFPENVKVHEFLQPKDFDAYFQSADVVISHAGMGTIIMALTTEKPLVIFPRQAALKEHRNDHQMATARKIAELNLVYVAFTEADLISKLSSLQLNVQPKVLGRIGDYASNSLIHSLDAYIKGL